MSHELTFSSTGNGPVQWIAGAYYFNQHYHDPITVSLPDQPQVGTPSGGPPSPGNVWFNENYGLTTTSVAGYGQLDWKVTDTIKLTGGLRYTSDHKYGYETYRLISFSDSLAYDPYYVSAENLGSWMPAVDITAGVLSGGGYNLPIFTTYYKGVKCLPTLQADGSWRRCLDDTSTAVTGTFGVEWTPDAHSLGYVRYNRGYKAFGFNAGTITPSPEVKPETIDDVEIGWKQTLSSKFQYNIDAFYYNYENDQVPVTVNNGALATAEFFNIPKAVADGIELQFIWQPIERLNVTFDYGFNHTEILTGCSLVAGNLVGFCEEDINDPQAVANGAKPVGQVPTSTGPVTYQGVKGNPLPQAPEHKVGVNVNYTWEFEPGNFTLSGSFVWKDKSYAGIFQRSYYSAPSWNQVDLRAVWSGDHDRYEIVAYVKNLFDTLGYDAAGGGIGYYSATSYPNPAGQNTTFDLTPPRTYGVEVHYKF